MVSNEMKCSVQRPRVNAKSLDGTQVSTRRAPRNIQTQQLVGLLILGALARSEATVFERLAPPTLDNSYRGARIAPWLLGLVVGLKATQSLAIIFNGRYTATGADGIPLDTYPAAATQTILALFALLSLWRLVVCIAGVVVLLRYRAGVPLMLALLLAQYLANQLLLQFTPLVHVGTPPGPIINLVLGALMLVGLVLSLRGPASPASAT
jgi:hypothetical protein